MGQDGGVASPDLGLVQAVLDAVARYTGRAVHQSQITTLNADWMEITIQLAEDGDIDVSFSDPMAIHHGPDATDGAGE